VAGRIGVRAIALCLLALTAPALAGKQVVDRVVAVVNDAVILKSELDSRLVALDGAVAQIPDPAERERRRNQLAAQMLDQMIADELIVQAANEAKLTVEQSELQATIDYIKQKNNLDDKQLAEAMKAEGITFESFKKDLLRQRAIAQLVAPKIHISDDDALARYNELKRRATDVAAVRASQILIKVPDHATEQQLADAKARATRAIDRVKAGEAFADVAKDMSDDPTTKPTGGEIGWLEAGTLSDAWEPVVMGMQVGDVRGPIAGPDGLYVLYASELKKTALQPFPEMKEKLKRELQDQQLEKARQAWIAELRKKAYIDIKLR
jgi:peptidyl-prolyl cis-trans isomerase SurA